MALPPRPPLDRRRAASLGLAAGVGVVTFFALRAFFGAPGLSGALEEAVAQLSPSLPIAIDEVTTWTGVEAQGDTMVVTYTLAGAAAEYDAAALLDAVRPAVAAQACVGPEEGSGEALGMGATFRYRYVAEEGGEVGAFDVTQADCAG